LGSGVVADAEVAHLATAVQYVEIVSHLRRID
jgi:hypothetical protein